MSRRILIPLCPLLFVATIAVPAQRSGGEQAMRNSEFAWQDGIAPSYRPEPPWVAAKNITPRYPITVRLEIDYSHYNGYSYTGGGEAHAFNPHGEDFQFKYRCGITFRSHQPVEFYGRWINPHKLEILLRRPYSNSTRTCRVSTTTPVSSLRASMP
jgi:hypothetical protein